MFIYLNKVWGKGEEKAKRGKRMQEGGREARRGKKKDDNN